MNNVRFKQRAQLLIVGVIALAVSLLFTACPNTAGGKPAGGGGGNTPATPEYTVNFTVDGTPPNGTITAAVDGTAINTGAKVQQGKTVVFTATPNTNFKVDKWTITGGSFETGTGAEASLTAQLKVTADATVTVSFTRYTKVPYADLETYLATTALSEKLNYIEVTGTIPKEDFTGSDSTTGALGQKLKAHPNKKVALKIKTYPEGLTDMSYCFLGCTSLLTRAPAIPAGVTDMRYCFAGCTNLITAPAIPAGVTDMRYCFDGCTNLRTAPAIPEGVTNMRYCFAGCDYLTTAPAIPAGVTNMDSCFIGCDSLTTAPAIPASVKNMYRCFQDCYSLTTVPAIPEGVTDMRDCFWGCTSLTTVPAIPASVTDMEGCFYDCTKLTGVTLKCNYSADKFNYAFTNCTALQNGSIKVPAGQLQTYKDHAADMGTTAQKFAAIQ